MTTTYTGGCHCGAVRYQVELSPPEELYACNCSICSRAGWLLLFVPGDSFQLRSGQDKLSDYQFAKEHIHHRFCSVCGVRSFSHGADPATGGETYSINVRCLDGFSFADLPVKTFDGAAL